MLSIISTWLSTSCLMLNELTAVGSPARDKIARRSRGILRMVLHSRIFASMSQSHDRIGTKASKEKKKRKKRASGLKAAVIRMY